jgi:hypothetical protein
MGYDLEADDPLENCLDNGFELLLYLIAIGANGSIVVARYTLKNNGLKATVLTEHIESDGFHVPMNVVIVGAQGQAARTLVTKDGTKKVTID